MTIAVYCSAKDVIPEEFLQIGDTLGTWIGEHGHTLVYGGATGGLMSRTSNAAKTAGAHVIGVIPPRIKAAGRLATNCDELVEVSNMNERKQKMKSGTRSVSRTTFFFSIFLLYSITRYNTRNHLRGNNKLK